MNELWGFDMHLTVQYAIEEINLDPTILPDYELSMPLVSNTAGDSKGAYAEAIWQWTNFGDSLVGGIGEGYSGASIPLAGLAAVYAMPLVSYASTTPTLSDPDLYPYFLRTCASDIGQARAWLAIAKKYGWTRVGTLNTQGAVHSLLTGYFISMAQAEGIDVIVAESFPELQGKKTETQLEKFNRNGIKVIFLAADWIDVVDLFEILRTSNSTEDLRKPDIAWIGTDAWLSPQIYIANISGAIGTNFATGPDTPRRAAILERYYQESLFQFWDGFTDFTYDTVKVYATALHRVLYEYETPLDEPLAGNVTAEWRRLFYEDLLENTNFTGLSGQVKFDENGDGQNRYRVLNLLGDRLVQTAVWDPLDDSWVEYEEVIWQDGTTDVPKDRYIPEIIYISNGVRITFIVLAALAFILPITHSILLIVYWKHPIVVASTPEFMALILFGSMLSLSVVWIISQVPTVAVCTIPHWFGHMAFWIIFSCLFTKTARIYYLFRRAEKCKSVKPVTLIQLVVSCSVLSGAVSIYLAIWTGVHGMNVNIYEDQVNPERIHIIECDYGVEWASALYAVELVFMVAGVFLAYKINKIKVLKQKMLHFNESAHISVCIYSLVFIGVVIIPNFTWLATTNDTKYVLQCIGLIVAPVTINLVLFSTKFVSIFRGKKTDSSGSNNTNQASTSKTTTQ
eukprot:TRINITY_DN6417_c0_g1_i1.p1 TRINITY_DN6417_c0_g1~~TRINITY_DN6417_c0_g1_i1.p1  ORF type:complete len:739 (-),score=126.12 TRINITY_DN6417_c0_g1_i1:85-2127(-)